MSPLVALLLFAAPAAPVTVPFPAPKAILVNDQTKADWGTVSGFSADGDRLTIETETGPVTFAIDPKQPVYGTDGREQEQAVQLKPGDSVRIYFELLGNTVEDGGRIREIDLI